MPQIFRQFGGLGKKGIRSDFPLNAENRAFRYGDGIMESAVVRLGQPFNWEGHQARFFRGMEVLGMSDREKTWLEIREAWHHLWLRAEQPRYARLRAQVWREGGGFFAPESNGPQFLAELFPLEKDPWSPRQVHCGFLKGQIRYPNPLAEIKSSSALAQVLGAREAGLAGWDEGIFLSWDGSVAEGTRTNIFVRKEGGWVTPGPESGCHAGTLRDFWLDRGSHWEPLKVGKVAQEDLLSNPFMVGNAVMGLQCGYFSQKSPKTDPLFVEHCNQAFWELGACPW